MNPSPPPSQLHRVAILGTGSYAPAQRLTNADLKKMVDTNDEWIVQRTGISERRMAPPDESPSTMASAAARKALEAAGMKPEDLQLIVCGTSLGDTIVPCTATRIQTQLGCRNAGACDVNAACSGFVYALSLATRLVSSGAYERVLVCGTETVTRGIDYTDRSTCVIFGDGAGAVILGRSTGESDILHSELGADGWQGEAILMKGGGAVQPANRCTDENRSDYFVRMAGRDVYKFAVTTFVGLTQRALAAASLTIQDLSCLVPHQVNLRIIESACERLGLPLDKVAINIQTYGNTSAASVPLAFDEAVRAGRIKRGDIVLMIGFGGGLTWGSVLLKY